MDLSRLLTPEVNSEESRDNAAIFRASKTLPQTAFARDHGFAIVRRNGSNYVNGQATYYTLRCDRDTVRQTRAVGLRQLKTQKVGCP
ncbi:hypothetical protein CSAL01_01406 [Colletotrichum salicis]|uniref:Uncharacterized protein n=1 Tax=Colletotrichum salicis TaxID=1209931 RepID=A0A135SX16_9PEZI|nr:hypothetical protein CSAL01_01406 [Colletotrichum salicis]